MEEKDYRNPEYYVNRELSWLLFDRRVLSEARDKTIPLFERLKFLSITSSNLDEFFMVRVASLKDQVHAQYTKPDIAGLTPKEQLKRISEDTHELVQLQYSTYNRSVCPALKKKGGPLLDHPARGTDESPEKFRGRIFRGEHLSGGHAHGHGLIPTVPADPEQIFEHRRADL